MSRKKDYDEYFILEEALEKINDALAGSCDDIDCDKYTYKNLLKKGYRPTLEHGYSCMKKLKRDRDAVMRLLSLKKFRKFRYKKCDVCNRKLDKLSEDYYIVGLTQPCENKKYYRWESMSVHRKCKRKAKIPTGWKEL